MKVKFRIDGLYDKRTLDFLSEMGIYDYLFDFRPKSFNFLQQYRFYEILEHYFQEAGKNPLDQSRFYLYYDDEKDFIIKKMVDDLRGLLRSSLKENHFSRFFLEFSDNRDVSFYESFGVPFYWHFRPDRMLSPFLRSPLLKGVVLPFSFLERLHSEGTLLNFVQNFHAQLLGHATSIERELVLSLDWGANIFPSLFEYFDFDMLALPVNNKVEVSYRLVNLQKIAQELGHFLYVSENKWP